MDGWDARIDLTDALLWTRQNAEALENRRSQLSAETIAAHRQALGSLLYPLRQTPLASYDDSA